MNLDFVSKWAPQFRLSKQNSAPRAGLDPQPYDAQGTPLPWLSEGGGPRQYFGTPGPDGLRGRLPTPEVPQAPVSNNDAMFGARLADEPPMPLDDEVSGMMPTRVDPRADFQSPAPQDLMRRPPVVQGELTLGTPRPINAPRVDPRADLSNQSTGPQKNTFDTGRAPAGQTLGDLISQYGFRIPQMPRPNREIRGRQVEEFGLGALAQPVMGDPNQGLSRQPQGHSVYNAPSGLPNFSTPQGLTEFNQRTGFNIGNQVRTQAEQDSLFQRGLTRAQRSYHQTGEAFDIPGSALNGLTGQAAVNEVRNRLRAAGYPDMELRWESGHGRNQGTGRHVHAEPAR